MYVEDAPLARLTAQELGFSEPLVWTGDDEAALLAEADATQAIVPVLIVASSAVISNMLRCASASVCEWHVPLLSLSMYDAFGGSGAPPFMHFIGNTATWPAAVMWCNAA